MRTALAGARLRPVGANTQMDVRAAEAGSLGGIGGGGGNRTAVLLVSQATAFRRRLRPSTVKSTVSIAGFSDVFT
jgi:hypothetical protein